MAQRTTNNTTIYEGEEPYLFISYSHRDISEMERVKAFFDDQGIRYWYDDGLHSGDDWNMVIAKHLQNAAICLLLLSPNSAESEYVKNELNFAMNRRIPIHTLLLKKFELPADIEMMTGRIQMVEMKGDYGTALLKSLPAEIFCHSETSEEKQAHLHPLYQLGDKLYERQGTTTFVAEHKRLYYPCIVQLDLIKPSDKYEIQNLCFYAGNVNHPLFPKIIDVEFKQNQMWTYQEHGEEQFLDLYLKEHEFSQEKILQGILDVLDGMNYLYMNQLGLRDFARGSLMVTKEGRIRISRLQNLYYGLVPLKDETRLYYLEKEIQEIGIFIAQLCLGKFPSLPIQMIEEPRFDKNFLDVMNLVIQKCAKENGKSQYASFEQLKADLLLTKISLKDKMFLKNRKKKLEQYNHAKEARTERFTANDAAKHSKSPILEKPKNNLEEEFGFETTVTLGSNEDEKRRLSFVPEQKPEIRIKICSTGEVLSFAKTNICLGRDRNLCDMVWNQPYISRQHLEIEKISDKQYHIRDLYSANGVFILVENNRKRITAGSTVEVAAGDHIWLGQAEMQII